MTLTTINEKLAARWPWVLAYEADANPAWSAHVVRVVVAVAALAAMSAFNARGAWVNTALAA